MCIRDSVKGDRLLVLVRIEERILLLGSAQGNITVLQDFPAEALSLANGNPVQPETENLFSRLLAACRERVKSEKEGAGL